MENASLSETEKSTTMKIKCEDHASSIDTEEIIYYKDCCLLGCSTV
jgi:hypothetical protein